ncbi:nitroreductase [Pseudomonas syringae group genomosp. 3]|uniref:nitroreductase n=1 Tax=Pseudomonas syringae group genomosp. 3 TaxID=251701 RepID=UPI000F00AE56|nr:nitroreductase [Pseudomonas syringae group genomosp. 3]
MSMGIVFEQIVRARRATRQFLTTPLTADQIVTVLSDAQSAPSNCNTQPWYVHVVSGATKQRLSAALINDEEQGYRTPDFSFDSFDGVYAERHHAMAQRRNDAVGISRDDEQARHEDMLRNLRFYGAPHVAFLFMPVYGDSVRVAGDIGMYAQTLLLSLTAHGFAGIPQTVLGFYPHTVREVLEVSDGFKLLFGISFGYADPDAPSQQLDVGRAAIGESVIFHD